MTMTNRNDRYYETIKDTYKHYKTSPIGLLHDLAGGNEALVKDVQDWDVLKDVREEIMAMICDPTIHGVTTTLNPGTPAPTTTTTTSTSKKVCKKPVDIVFIMDVSSSIQDQCMQTAHPMMECWPYVNEPPPHRHFSLLAPTLERSLTGCATLLSFSRYGWS